MFVANIKHLGLLALIASACVAIESLPKNNMTNQMICNSEEELFRNNIFLEVNRDVMAEMRKMQERYENQFTSSQQHYMDKFTDTMKEEFNKMNGRIDMMSGRIDNLREDMNARFGMIKEDIERLDNI